MKNIVVQNIDPIGPQLRHLNSAMIITACRRQPGNTAHFNSFAPFRKVRVKSAQGRMKAYAVKYFVFTKWL